MTKNNDDFFVRKSEWAKVKDSLLGYYLKPYLAKILFTRRPLLYIDCFAGKGRFDDGGLGSPLLACQDIKAAVSASKARDPRIKAVFIEKRYGSDLRSNLKDYGFSHVIDGTYEDTLGEVLKVGSKRSNLFEYVDPYGVTSLDAQHFIELPNVYASAEFLLNFNSFGFFRAACQVCNIDPIVAEEDDDLIEREPADPSSPDLACKLSRAVGGEFWRDVVAEYKGGLIDGYEAEWLITKGLQTFFSSSYKYVLNIPVRIRKGNRPKYRMMFATNHPEGCLLMYQSMWNGLRDLELIQTSGQMSIFESGSEGEIVDPAKVEEDLRQLVAHCDVFVDIDELLADFAVGYGITLSVSALRDILRRFEAEGSAIVKRTPALTKRGKPTTFMQTRGQQKVFIRRSRA